MINPILVACPLNHGYHRFTRRSSACIGGLRRLLPPLHHSQPRPSQKQPSAQHQQWDFGMVESGTGPTECPTEGLDSHTAELHAERPVKRMRPEHEAMDSAMPPAAGAQPATVGNGLNNRALRSVLKGKSSPGWYLTLQTMQAGPFNKAYTLSSCFPASRNLPTCHSQLATWPRLPEFALLPPSARLPPLVQCLLCGRTSILRSPGRCGPRGQPLGLPLSWTPGRGTS